MPTVSFPFAPVHPTFTAESDEDAGRAFHPYRGIGLPSDLDLDDAADAAAWDVALSTVEDEFADDVTASLARAERMDAEFADDVFIRMAEVRRAVSELVSRHGLPALRAALSTIDRPRATAAVEPRLPDGPPLSCADCGRDIATRQNCCNSFIGDDGALRCSGCDWTVRHPRHRRRSA